jgi:predicted nucleic acid-binding protein
MMLGHGASQRAVFVDTSAFYADIDRGDARHGAAGETFQDLMSRRALLFCSNLVVAETHALIMRRLGASLARRWLRALDANVLFEDEADDVAAHTIIARYADKDFSYADAVSFALMERLGIPAAFTFDAHFRQYGFDTIPEPSRP